MKQYKKIADALTPMAKGLSSEYCNQNAYDCIQVHGGSGFMKTMLANASTAMHALPQYMKAPHNYKSLPPSAT